MPYQVLNGKDGQRNMRKNLSHFVINDVYETLAMLGYSKIRQDSSEWRRQRFHLFILKRRGSLTLNIHEDMPSAMPPFHRARHTGKSLEQELAKIEEAYKRRRAATRTQKNS